MYKETNKPPKKTTTQKMQMWMYNEFNSLTFRHKITQDKKEKNLLRNK